MGRRRLEGSLTSNRKRGRCSSEFVDFVYVQSILRKRLAVEAFPLNLERFGEQARQLKELLIRTVTFSESNSVLLIGDRGSGKYALLHKVKQDLCGVPDFSNHCVTVTLNGLVHSDDRIALKDIVHQLKLESFVESRGSFADTLTFILETLKSGDHCKKSVLFILDEFDLFCQNKNQLLLYNLLDVAQCSQVPVAIVGLTCRLDVLTLLEKRVKSRFSHRMLYLFSHHSFGEYINVTKNLLSLQEETSLSAVFIKEWNAHIKELLENNSVRKVLEKLYKISNSDKQLKKFLLLPISAINENHRYVVPSDFTELEEIFSGTGTDMLLGLSVLEFCLIVTMAHLNIVHDGEPLNFEIIFHEFEHNVQKKALLQQFNKAVVMKAFEHLLSLELVKIIDGNTGNSQKNYRLVRLLLVQSQVKEALQLYPNLPTDFQHWASTALS